MEIEHGKTWSYTALFIGLAVILLYVYSGIYALMGVLLGFLGLTFMAAIYLNLYGEYIVLYQKQTEEETARKVELARFGPITPENTEDIKVKKHGKQKTDGNT